METGCHLAFVQIGFGNRTAKRTGAPQFNYDQYFTEISQSISTHVQQSKVKVSWSTSQPIATLKNAVSTLLNDRCVKMNVGRRAGATARFDVGSVSLDFKQQRQRRSQSNFNREPLSRRHQRPHFYFSCFSFHSTQFPPPHFHFSAFEFIWFVPSSSTRLLHPINGFWIRLESTWLWLVDFKIIPQW